MKPDKQRIAIAEACGWERKPKFDYARLMRGTVDAMERVEMWGTDQGHLIPFDTLPDYPADLNAMHEAEKTLVKDGDVSLCNDYADYLHEVTARGKSPLDWRLWHATAVQRAEAFLRTIGKWEDDK